MMDDTAAHSQTTTRSWLKAEASLGRAAARPIVLLGLAGTLLAMGQSLCAAVVLTAALAGVGEGASAGLPKEPDGGGVAACTDATEEGCSGSRPVLGGVEAAAVPALARSSDCWLA